MLKKSIFLAAGVFVVSIVLLLSVWQYQRRTLSWIAVPIEITSSDIARFRKRRLGRVWSAEVEYTFKGQHYTRTMHDLPFNPTEVFVDPSNPTHVAGERGPTIRGLFIPIIAVSSSGLFLFVLFLIRLSPAED
ncbi:MAG: DUF3592 domain-containing protein [Planctomycetota bacterium]